MARTVNSPTNTDGPKPSPTAGTQNSEPGMGPTMVEIRNQKVSGTITPQLKAKPLQSTASSGEHNPAPSKPQGQ